MLIPVFHPFLGRFICLLALSLAVLNIDDVIVSSETGFFHDFRRAACKERISTVARFEPRLSAQVSCDEHPRLPRSPKRAIVLVKNIHRIQQNYFDEGTDIHTVVPSALKSTSVVDATYAFCKHDMKEVIEFYQLHNVNEGGSR